MPESHSFHSSLCTPPQWERRHQARGDEVLLAARKDQWHSQVRRLDDETSGWKTFDDVVRLVFTSKQIGGRPSLVPKLAMDTEYISRASRALAAMTLVRRAFWIRTRDVDRWLQSRLLDGSWVDNRGYHDLLHPYGSGAAMVKI